MLRAVILGLAVASLALGCGRKGPVSSPSAGDRSSSAGPTPEDGYNAIRKAMLAGDGPAIWEMVCRSSKRKMVDRTSEQLVSVRKAGGEQLKAFADMSGISIEDAGTISAEDLTARTVSRMFSESCRDPEERRRTEGTRFAGAEMRGDRAWCRTSRAEGKDGFVVLIREDGVWKLDIEESQKCQDEKGSK